MASARGPEAAPPFTGVGVALVTLFDHRGDLDAPATAQLAARLVGLGVKAVVVAGSTGEAAALAAEERDELLRAVREVVTSVPVIAGTGAPSARQAAALTRAAADNGADAVLVLSPPGADDPRPYYDDVAQAAGSTPVLAYSWPSVSPPGIPTEMLVELPVAGCKDSSGSADRLLATLAAYPGPLYVGSSALLALAGPTGCAGAIVGLANADPEGCIASFSGDGAAQRALAAGHARSSVALPRGVKELTAERFGTSAVARMG